MKFKIIASPGYMYKLMVLEGTGVYGSENWKAIGSDHDKEKLRRLAKQHAESARLVEKWLAQKTEEFEL